MIKVITKVDTVLNNRLNYKEEPKVSLRDIIDERKLDFNLFFDINYNNQIIRKSKTTKKHFFRTEDWNIYYFFIV